MGSFRLRCWVRWLRVWKEVGSCLRARSDPTIVTQEERQRPWMVAKAEDGGIGLEEQYLGEQDELDLEVELAMTRILCRSLS